MNNRKILLLLIDMAVMLCTAILIAYIFPAIGSVGIMEECMSQKIAVLAVCLFGMRCLLRLYSHVWRYANVRIYLRLMLSDGLGYLCYLLLGRAVPTFNPGIAYATVTVMSIMLITLLSRFMYQRLHANLNSRKEQAAGTQNKINVAIIGAGNVGTALAEELLRNPRSRYVPYCFIDKDEGKVGSKIRGIRIYPENDKTMELLKMMPVQEIVIAIPDTTTEAKSALYERYRSIGCPVKLYDYLGSPDGINETRTLRDFNIEDLLFRNTIQLESELTAHFYAQKTILVTGGGGSIGSELCRQIAKQRPKKLVIFDIYENNAYDIQQELRRTYGTDLNLEVAIGSVRDAARLDEVFGAVKPEIVIHAAAHKHVPLMESDPAEAFKNNVLGTYNAANMAEKHGVSKFLLISTDKAVNPTNIMGASKRLCEMVVQCRTDSKTEFAAVRFGNVLGSNGSVIPLFRKQIEQGGPVTLTDKRVIRYFMTIPEAVQLVLEAGAMAKDGELFVLDMGNPVKILELAENLIRLSGYRPYQDIDIVEVGLRPGEKLYEELLINSTTLNKTENEKIFIERDDSHSRAEIEEKLAILTKAAEGSREDVFAAFRQTVSTYHTPGWEEPTLRVVHPLAPTAGKA